jgi:hypothetical protein
MLAVLRYTLLTYGVLLVLFSLLAVVVPERRRAVSAPARAS